MDRGRDARRAGTPGGGDLGAAPRHRRRRRVRALLTRTAAGATAALLAVAAADGSGDRRYLEDFAFIDEAVRREAAAPATKSIDWAAHAARLRPRFASCAGDADHLRNIMELLAGLRDSHTGVLATPVKDLPSRFDGLYGAGLDFGYDHGRFVLQGVRAGHAQQSVLVPGSTLVAVADEPAWLNLARDRRRIGTLFGVSSDHSLYAAHSNRLLPFGERQTLELTFLQPDGETRTVTVGRWGPAGQAFDPGAVQLPAAIEPAPGAVSGRLRTSWSDAVGYLRITGGMDRPTAEQFHAALDRLRGVEAILLDGRGMGGGGDGPAWEMAGRFFPDGADNGAHGRIEPTGSWQFDGPLVLLQDATMVSSAETFTWALSETGRAVTVGRPTGGWGIIPKVFECPSGLCRFRLGVTDRKTPIRGVRTEGSGWPPDVQVPFGPVFAAEPDPVRAVGMDALHLLHAGFAAGEVRTDLADLFAGDVRGFRQRAARYAGTARGFAADELAGRVLRDLEGELEMTLRWLALDPPAFPDLAGIAGRAEELGSRARRAGLGARAAVLGRALQSVRKEQAAQTELLELISRGDEDDAGARRAWLGRHGRTRLARLVGKSAD